MRRDELFKSIQPRQWNSAGVCHWAEFDSQHAQVRQALQHAEHPDIPSGARNPRAVLVPDEHLRGISQVSHSAESPTLSACSVPDGYTWSAGQKILTGLFNMRQGPLDGIFDCMHNTN